MKDLHNNIEIPSTAVLAPVTVSTTQTLTDIDLAGANSCEIEIAVGADAGTGLSSSHKIVFVLSDSDDGTTYTAVEDADMLGVEDISSGTILTIDATDEDNTTYRFGYVGGKRYLQLVGTVTGTISMPMYIDVSKGHLLDAPIVS